MVCSVKNLEDSHESPLRERWDLIRRCILIVYVHLFPGRSPGPSAIPLVQWASDCTWYPLGVQKDRWGFSWESSHGGRRRNLRGRKR
jgi:hypothetical protein